MAIAVSEGEELREQIAAALRPEEKPMMRVVEDCLEAMTQYGWLVNGRLTHEAEQWFLQSENLQDLVRLSNVSLKINEDNEDEETRPVPIAGVFFWAIKAALADKHVTQHK